MSSRTSFSNSTIPEHETSTEHELRLEKVAELRKRGIEPWPASRPVSTTCAEALNSFLEGGEQKTISLAGRMVSRRLHGKTAFAHLQDRSGKLQIYIKADDVGAEQFAVFTALFDLGDIVWATGTPFKTKTGEVTLHVLELALLSKCLYPLPEKFHGLTDTEARYRARYLDLITSQETRERFKARSAIMSFIRHYLEALDFIEVETPMLHPIPGGALARPFVTHHNALDLDLYLRIAPELYLKRLVIGGFERVFEINRNFRNEGISTRHNPEFTMLEFYQAHATYRDAMDLVEDMLRSIAQKICGSTKVPYGDVTIDLGAPFARMSMEEAIVAHSDIKLPDLSEKNIDETLKKAGVALPTHELSRGSKIMLLFEAIAEKKLINPTFIINFPVEVSPLAKRDEVDKNIAARFELFIVGMEFANSFNELNDPLDQAERFKAQAAAHGAGDSEAHRYDADYIHALEHGLPPTVGVGIGIDRLVMLMTHTPTIKDVILFPTLRPKSL